MMFILQCHLSDVSYYNFFFTLICAHFCFIAIIYHAALFYISMMHARISTDGKCSVFNLGLPSFENHLPTCVY